MRRPCKGPGVPPVNMGMATRPEKMVVKTKADREQYLGDYTKKLLEKSTLFGLFPNGITPEVIAEIKKKHGFAPTCGGCGARQAWLNEVDKTARSWTRKGIAWIRKMFGD